MKPLTTLTAAIIIAINCSAQVKPKQHIFYDTVKTVQQRVDFSPDTIPVYFKELVIADANSYPLEKWQIGYVVWQTYKKPIDFQPVFGGLTTFSMPEYYEINYPFSQTLPGTFLYSDRKTKVTNKVIFSIKR